jgi:phosphatidylglycerol:prolipoprotein diacylglycerol transferase
VVLGILAHQQKIRERLGTLSGVFLIGYALSRMLSEMFREPETLTGTLVETTWGQWLSVPMLVYGLYLVWRGRKLAQT